MDGRREKVQEELVGREHIRLPDLALVPGLCNDWGSLAGAEWQATDLREFVFDARLLREVVTSVASCHHPDLWMAPGTDSHCKQA